MQRRYLWALAGALAFTASASRPAHAAAPAVPGAPAGWVHEDIGGPGAAGDAKVAGTGPTAVWTVSGSGSDIQGSADLFQYAYTTLTGDGGITARILSQKAGEPTWTKTGVMLRESNAPGARMMILAFTSNAGLEGGSREDTDGGWSSPGANGVGRHSLAPGPIWLRVQHKGTDFSLLSSDDGSNWKQWGHKTIAMDVSKPILAGLAVTSHMDGDLANATFDNVAVDSNIIVPPPTLPAVQAFPGPGAVLITYGGAANAVGYNIYRRAAADTPDKAVLVNSQPNPYTWFIDDNGGKGLANGTALIYQVKAVMKDATGTLSEADASDRVSATPQLPVNGRFIAYDIGTANPGSVTVDDKNVLTIKASGADIWQQSDGGTYLVTPVAGDYSISAKLLSKPTVNAAADQVYAKVGLIIREGLGQGAPYSYVFASTNRPDEVLNEFRKATLNSDGNQGGVAGTSLDNTKFPLWLKLTKTGNMIAAFQSNDGTSYTAIGDPVDFTNLTDVTYAGIAATAHNDGGYVTGQIDATTLQIK